MTRKQVLAIGNALRATRPTDDKPERVAQWHETLGSMAEMLHRECGLNVNGNRKFDRAGFIAYCIFNTLTTV